MKNQPKIYLDYIHRGRKVVIDGKTYQNRVGAVAAVVEGESLQVGWSLCNFKEGDRFNLDHANCLAIGRTRNLHQNSLSFRVSKTKADATQKAKTKLTGPTMTQLIQRGVPQSSLVTMSRIIQKALTENPEITEVKIYNTKTPRMEPTPQHMW